MSLLERTRSLTWAAADPTPTAAGTPREAAPRRRPFLARPLTRPHMVVGLALVGLVVAAALLAPLLAPAPPDLVAPALRLQAPSLAHPFGTDPFGRDLFSRVLYGARIALLTALGALLVSAIPGILLGMLAGYHRGRFEQVVSRGMDAWLAFPGLLLAIVLVARLGPSLSATALALGIVGIPWYYRTARSGTLSVRQAAYVEAAECIGAASGRVLMRHILPNLTSPLVVLSTLRLGTVLLAVGGLSLIGLGAQPPSPEWGALLAAGRDYMDTAWWLAAFPGLALTVTVMGFNLLGDGLRDALAFDTGHHHGPLA